MRGAALAAAVCCAAAVIGGCSDAGAESTSKRSTPKPSLTIGAYDFSESVLLANIYGGALRAKGYQVALPSGAGRIGDHDDRKRVAMQASAVRGGVDAFITYAASELRFASGAATSINDIDTVADQLGRAYGTIGLDVLDPSEAVDTNAFAVTPAVADRLNLDTVSDLAPVVANLMLGGPADCPQRTDCAVGLQRVYGVTPTFVPFESTDAAREALRNGTVDVAVVGTTDGGARADGLELLRDDRSMQGADNVVPVIRADKSTREIRRIWNVVSAKLTTSDLQRMNKQIESDQQAITSVVSRWLRANGFA